MQRFNIFFNTILILIYIKFKLNSSNTLKHILKRIFEIMDFISDNSHTNNKYLKYFNTILIYNINNAFLIKINVCYIHFKYFY